MPLPGNPLSFWFCTEWVWQCVRLWRSVEGLSLTSFVSELVAYTIITAYNFNLGELILPWPSIKKWRQSHESAWGLPRADTRIARLGLHWLVIISLRAELASLRALLTANPACIMLMVMLIYRVYHQSLQFWPAGYPFSSYGEVAACWIQDIILVFLVLYFRSGPFAESPLGVSAHGHVLDITEENVCNRLKIVEAHFQLSAWSKKTDSWWLNFSFWIEHTASGIES